MKRCFNCHEIKPLSEFSPNGARGDGHSSCCKGCRAERARTRRLADPERVRQAERAYRDRNPERLRVYRAENLDRVRASERRTAAMRRMLNKTAVFAHYGTSCACCGAVDRLTIDHINGDGKAGRLVHGRGSQFYAWLVCNGFPEGFQTLCFPCNHSKRDGTRCRLDHKKDALAAAS